MTSALTDRIGQLIAPSLESMGYEIVRIRYTGGARPVLQIMAERMSDGGMEVEDCETVSHAVSALLDVEDPVSEAYSLEVSSPGIDRPLTRRKDFERYAGHDARVELHQPIDGRKRFKGLLTGLDGDAVKMELNGVRPEDAAVTLPLDDIADAKLVLTDRLIEASLKESKAREKARRKTEETE
ncbi:ribosome maturation factor RimP [Minwuia thermotolerans]|uniref:Ribosome maturation factor RimP n=1 Tax=Minwuia thermotolerans TaxID=2056226 RepID=A0A2M9G230_9PROT|nr:ribosome maturation factor RimP [Minwuia thermotolerans]PJK29787.1 ribosome maturation factor RimP [Minwuia thermotolerans]